MAAAIGNRHRKQPSATICEKSSELATNFIRSSSLLLANVLTLGRAAARAPVDPPPRPGDTLQEMEPPETRRRRATAYVMRPRFGVGGGGEVGVDGAAVDARAADYIRRVRARNRSSGSPEKLVIFPPPPMPN